MTVRSRPGSAEAAALVRSGGKRPGSEAAPVDEAPAGLRPGRLAREAGVNRETLRYYERRGIIAEPKRTVGGHRVYPPETVAVLRAVKAAQRLGFSLSEVAQLLSIGARRRGEPGLRARAAAKVAEVERRIADLTTVAAILRVAVAVGCDDLVDCADAPDCPIPFDGGGASGDG